MPADTLRLVYRSRHDQTVWSLPGQHNGLSDLPLTPAGEGNARRPAPRPPGHDFAQVLCSPQQRVRRCCELAGCVERAEFDARLLEWDNGDCEGRTSAEVYAQQPGWPLFRDGCPGGESPAQVSARADSLIATLRGGNGHTLPYSSGHFLRMLAARRLGLTPADGACFMLDTASLSAPGYEHTLQQPVIRLWNEIHHVQP